MEIEGLPVIEVDESDEITVAVRADDLIKGDTRVNVHIIPSSRGKNSVRPGQ
jgi:hypothetical protein